jgi:hypothetical protein
MAIVAVSETGEKAITSTVLVLIVLGTSINDRIEFFDLRKKTLCESTCSMYLVRIISMFDNKSYYTNVPLIRRRKILYYVNINVNISYKLYVLR